MVMVVVVGVNDAVSDLMEAVPERVIVAYMGGHSQNTTKENMLKIK